MADTPAPADPAAETLEQIQARHRKEQRDLVSRVTSKKKNATKKTRKGVNEECAEMERRLKERQAEEIAKAEGKGRQEDEKDEKDEQEQEQEQGDRPSREEDENGVDGVAEKMNGASIDDSTTQQQAQEQTGGGGKKRNRQKERLARRAAEQEAESLRAEKEASTMTDHRGLERKYMADVFKTHSLVEKDIRPDGHCLFAAVADQLRQLDVPLTDDAGEVKQFFPFQLVRRAAAGYMEGHEGDFKPFLEAGEAGAGDFGEYVARMRDTAEWGGQLELTALAARYGVEIRVVQDGRTEKIEPPEGAGGGDGGDGGERGVVWLAFYRHGYGLGEHYNSLRKVGKAS